MDNVLGKYYEGITRQLRAEVDVINALFSHQGEKGSGNEEALRRIVRSFVPERFGVGTGFVIDKNGALSRQCDIIIYDKQQYPSLFSLTSLHMFPVDIVLATVEVKTTLDKTKATAAITNIASVKELELLMEDWKEFSSEVSEGEFDSDEFTGSEVLWETHRPTPPKGYVFAYNSHAENFETFAEWFGCVGMGPDIAICMDQGFAYRLNGSLIGKCVPVEDGKTNGYPAKKVEGGDVQIDQARILLLFLLTLQNDLIVKKIHPAIRFVKHYPTTDLLRCRTVVNRPLDQDR